MVDHQTTELDDVFAAVSDGTRRSILQRLQQREATITELASPLQMSLEGVSKHVRVLERAGLITVRREGRSRIVTLNARPLAEAVAWLEGYRAFWGGFLEDLAAHVESPEPAARPRAPKSKGAGND